MTPQADWVKEFYQEFSFIEGCIDRDTLSNYLTIKKYGKEHLQDIEAFISKVETLAQQRTEKKWRDLIKSKMTDERKVAEFGEYEARTYNEKMLVNAVLYDLLKERV